MNERGPEIRVACAARDPYFRVLFADCVSSIYYILVWEPKKFLKIPNTFKYPFCYSNNVNAHSIFTEDRRIENSRSYH